MASDVKAERGEATIRRRTRAHLIPVGLALLLSVVAPAAAGGETLVARAWLRGAGEASATVFFLAVPTTPGAVAVGASRTFDRTSLAESGEVVFRDADGREVARSTRLYAHPGRPTNASL